MQKKNSAVCEKRERVVMSRYPIGVVPRSGERVHKASIITSSTRSGMKIVSILAYASETVEVSALFTF